MKTATSSPASPKQWMYPIRAPWGVETTHQILDVALKEDEHPWIESEPRAALVVAVIGVYTMFALFRSACKRGSAPARPDAAPTPLTDTEILIPGRGGRPADNSTDRGWRSLSDR